MKLRLCPIWITGKSVYRKTIPNKRVLINTQSIDLIVYDFDGVMTDNKVVVLEDGREAVSCSRTDGLAVSRIKKRGIPQIIMSSESNKVVKVRARKLGIPALCNVEDKKSTLLAYCKKNNYNLKKIIYIGNDINDLSTMRIVGYPIATLDAEKEIKNAALLIINKKGGEGVIKGLIEHFK